MRQHLRLPLLFGFILLAALMLTWAPLSAGQDGDPLRAAFEKAQAGGHGSYAFRAEIEQTYMPRPSVATMGRQSQRVDLHLEGKVQLPDLADIQFWAESTLMDADPVRLVRDGGQTFIERGDELVPVEDPVSMGSPDSDYLSFLVAAENVQELEPVLAGGQPFQRYSFELDGQRYAEHVRDVMARQLSGELPPNVTLSPPRHLATMTGQGELWIDEEGLPRRQIMDFAFPQISGEYDVRAHMLIDYRDFGQIDKLQVPVRNGYGGWRLETHRTEALRTRELGLHLSVDTFSVLVALSLGLAIIAFRKRRAVYFAVAITLILVFVTGPLLQAQRVVRFYTRQAAAAVVRTPISAQDLGLVSDERQAAQKIAETLEKAIHEAGPQERKLSDDGTPICGEGAIGVDSDGDGLGDYQESCYGTYYLDPDTDRDAITDTLEISGLVLPDADGNPVTWTSNAIRSDTNKDGLSDYSEWPGPIGEAPSWDPDGDHVPNIWDPDNDGDGVYDGADLSPYTATDYMKNFSVHTQGGTYQGYQYIEVQVQPQNLDHLRYTTTFLDWPDDDLGQIMDLDGSLDDVQLAPVLQVYTNVSPQLAPEYGITVQPATDTAFYDYVMYVPLQVVTDGGNISAFYAKAAYAPSEVSDVQWQASLVWVVQAKLDQYVNCSDPDNPNAASCDIDTQTVPVQTYGETFRITGLHVTKSQKFEMGILGTPDSPNEDKQLFNLTLGMAAAYLNNQHPDLQEVQQRFLSSDTPIEEKWGVTTQVAVDYAVYPHADQGWAETTSSKTSDYLNTNYGSTDSPSLLYAVQQDIGTFNMDSLEAPPSGSFNVSLDTIHVFTQRALKITTYSYQSSQWTGLSVNETLDLMQQRYPDLTDEDEFYINFFYPLWQQGNTQIIAVDGQAIGPDEANDKEIFEDLGTEATDTVHEFLESITVIGEIYITIVEGEGAVAGIWNLIRESENGSGIALTTGAMVVFFGAIALTMVWAFGGSDLLLEVAEWFVSGLATALAIYHTIEVLSKVESFGGLFSIIDAGKWARGMQVAGLVLQLILIWGFFGAFASGHSGLVVGVALAAAIAQTLIALVFFALSFIPFGTLLIALYALITFLVKAITGYSISEEFAAWLAGLFYDVKLLVKSPPKVEITTRDSLLATPEAGPVPGNQFVITADFDGQIEPENGGDIADLNKSDIGATWKGSAEEGAAKASAYAHPSQCTTTSELKECDQELEMRWALEEAERNMALELLTVIDFTWVAEGCPLIGSCSKQASKTVYPEEDDEDGIEKSTVTLYLDVLPGTLDELWDWDQINNPDRDGDGLSNEADPDPDNWDHDGDTLSDAYEVQNESTRGTKWNAWDSDGDGLGDWDETGLGSNAGDPDTDDDGLLDGEEWFHQGVDGTWSGGWYVRLFETTTAFTISDPSVADADTDDLLDKAERDGQSSPWATNVAPALVTIANPSVTGPGGRTGVFVKPGDPVSWFMTVLNDSNQVISSTMTTCLPDTLTGLSGGQLTGDVTAPLQIGACNGGTQYAWNFATPTELGLGLQVTTTISAAVDAALTSSLTTTISTTLPYSDTALVRGDTVYVDAENPLVAFTSPVDGAALRGDSFAVGGKASDVTSWVTAVEVDLADGQGWRTPSDLSPWSITWPSPADGVFTLKARSTDYVDRQSDVAQVTVTVDNTAPAASLSLKDGDFITDLDPYETGGALVNLTGSASDNLSGLDRVQISIDRKPWQQATLTTSGYPTQSDWSYQWPVPSDGAQGSHVVSVRAWDRSGNVSEGSSTTVILDLLPPGDMLSNLPPVVSDAASFSLEGHGDDIMNVPLPSRPEPLAGSGLDAYDSATIWLEPPSPLVTAGMTAAWLGDVDGDSRADLAVGLPAGDGGAGRVVLVYGQAGGWSRSTPEAFGRSGPVIPDAVALSTSPSAFVGAADAGIGGVVAPAGDVNGDGLSDLLIGDPANQRVFLVFGKTAPLGRNRSLGQPSSGDWVVLTTSDDLVIGSRVASAGDVNGDGFADLLIGGLNPQGGAGKAYLLVGQASSLQDTVDLATDAATGYPIPGNGAPATGVGDVNGDGFDDFAISDPLNALGNGRAVFLFLGGMTLPINPGASFLGDSNTAVGSQIVAAGDVNGDTLPDFAYSSGTRPRVAYGRTSGWTTGMTADVTFGGSTAFDAFVAAPGDVNVDGIDDILLGSSAGDGQAYLFHGAANLATNQPVQAQIANVAAAASAPYAAGADLNCDLSSDLLLVPQAASDSYDFQAAIGPAPAPRAMASLPGADQGSDPRLQARRATAAINVASTPALAFRRVDDNVSNWAVAAAFTGDFDGDGRSDVAGWTNTSLQEQPAPENPGDSVPGDAGEQIPEEGQAEPATGQLTDGENTIDPVDPVTEPAGTPAEEETAPLSSWRMWHSDGYSSQLQFTEYTNNLPAAITSSTARLLGDFDGDLKTDIAYWDGSQWQFLRSDGASGTSFAFTPVNSNLGNLASGDSGQMVLGDFDGDGRTDIAAWDGSAWATYISQASGTVFDFTQVDNNLVALASGNAAGLVTGDFDGDGLTDLAARNDAGSAWVVWRSTGLSGSSLVFDQIANTSLSPDIAATASRRSDDYDGDGKTDVLAVVSGGVDAWLGRGVADAMPFQAVANNLLQYSGQLLVDGLNGDFDGDGQADYASLDTDGAGWVFQLGGGSAVRYVDDDYCATCTNDGLTWGVDAFADLQPALDAAWFADTIVLKPGVYGAAVIHSGRDSLTLQGVDPDAVFLNGAGGIGLQVFPPADQSVLYPDIRGVTIRDLTIENAATGIQVNYGGNPQNATLSDPDNVRLRNLVVYLNQPNSTAVEVFQSAASLRHLTLVSNASGANLIHSKPGLLTSNAIYMQDNLLVALPNTAPLPAWWIDDYGNAGPTLNSHSGFVSINGQPSDWSVAPAGSSATLMTRDEAAFVDWSQQVFRIGADSSARGQAGDGRDLGYYSYRAPVTVDATFCPPPACENDGLTWGVDAFNTIQDGINSGAQKVLIDPGVYNEEIALVNGVSLFGSGAGHTYLAPSTANQEAGSFLVSAENVRHATVALLTVTGEDSSLHGLRVDGEGSLTVQRAIIRNTGTAVSVSGSSAGATLINDTLVNNDDGLSVTACGNLDLRNSILAFHQGTALSYDTAGCPSTQTVLHTYNDYWRNGHDLEIDGSFTDAPGPGEIFADPRFADPDNEDFRPLADSPVVDAGDPSDPTPPGGGDRIDLGYAQAAEAAVYASKAYCEQCLNDGLEWQVTAFDTIQDALDHVPDIEGIWTAGVAGTASSAFHEHLTLPSGIRLVGAGAGTTIIDGDDSGSVITMDGVTNVEITGFTITNSGEDAADAGILATGASNQITITRNIVGGVSPDNPGLPGNGNAGVIFRNDSTGQLLFNAVVANFGPGVVVQDAGSWLQARYNILAYNDAGEDNSGGGQIFGDYNLVYNTDPNWCSTCQDYVGTVTAGANDIVGQNPAFTDPDPGDGNYRLSPSSPAVDAVPSAFWPDVPPGGGDRADLGYAELVALPISLLLGKEGDSCALGNSGMASVEVGVRFVSDPSLPVDQTVPDSWQQATLRTPGETGSYWSTGVGFSQGNGLYRVYTRPADQTGNQSTDPRDWFRQAVTVDGSPPQVTLRAPTDGMRSSAPGLQLLAAVTDTLGTPRVSFLVDGVPVTPTVTVDGLYAAAVALTNGPHTIQAQATDQAGNTAQSAQARVVIITTANEAMLADPAPGSALASSQVSLRGYGHYQGKNGTGQVEVLVDGVSQGMATLADPSAQATSWTKAVTLTGDGDHIITLRASRTGGSGSNRDVTATLTLDTEAPSLSIEPVTQTIVDAATFAGTASDSGSGLARVELSLNGGRTWQEATLGNDEGWTFVWQPPLDLDYVSYGLLARAVDRAGNQATAASTPVVDNRPPTGLVPVTFDPPQGSYLDSATTLQISWSAVADGSGQTVVLVAVDQVSTTVPSQVVTGNSFSANLNVAGTWYAHLMVRDSAGNTMLRHFGPWNVAASTTAATTAGQSIPQQMIILDGLLDIRHGEWLTATERLNDDTRPLGRQQELFTTWDSSYFYTAWQGALWALDGVMVVYLDVNGGGTTEVLTLASTPLGITPLPMAADYAVTVDGPGAGTLWRYVASGGWQPDPTGGLEYAHGSTAGVELRLPRSLVGSGPVRMLALAVNDEGGIWSAFPTDNSLAAAATSTYTWDDLEAGVLPNAGQPTAHHVLLTIGSLLAGTGYAGPEYELDYLIQVENADNKPLVGAILELQASTGLGYEEATGATCQSCSPGGDRWLLQLPSIAAGSSQNVDVLAGLAPDLAGQQQATTTATIILSDGSTQSVSYSHLVDSQPPTVSFAGTPTLRSGSQVVRGAARDAGVGVSQVRWRKAGQAAWQEATGTRVWSFPVDVPAADTLSLEVQAIDSFGHESEIETVTFLVDDVPPVIEFALPPVVGGAHLVVDGIVVDPYPAGGEPQVVELQVNEDGPWSAVQGPFPPNREGHRSWHLVLRLPEVEGREYRLRARGIDAAGNIGEPTEWQPVVVDSIMPRTTIAEPEAGDQVGPGTTLVWGIAQDGWSVDRVEVSVDGGSWQQAATGAPALDLLAKADRQLVVPEAAVLWALTVNLPTQPGPVAIQARSVDGAGNVETPSQKVRVLPDVKRLWLPVITATGDGRRE